jgi:hypothetical protein
MSLYMLSEERFEMALTDSASSFSITYPISAVQAKSVLKKRTLENQIQHPRLSAHWPRP